MTRPQGRRMTDQEARRLLDEDQQRFHDASFAVAQEMLRDLKADLNAGQIAAALRANMTGIRLLCHAHHELITDTLGKDPLPYVPIHHEEA